VCDSCGEALFGLDDVETGIGAAWDIKLRIELDDERTRCRHCARCGAPMTIVALRASLGDRDLEIDESWPDAEQCLEHGVRLSVKKLADAFGAI
jgi:hypothetical protein